MKALLFSLVLIVVGCGKNDTTPKDTPRQAPANEQRQTNNAQETLNDLRSVLSNKKLMMNKVVVNGFELEIDECRKDDEIFINQNGTFESVDHTQCEEQDTNGKGSYEFYIQNREIYLVLKNSDSTEQEFQLLSYGLESITFQTEQNFEGEDYLVQISYSIN